MTEPRADRTGGDELLPCPFCGKQPIIIEELGSLVHCAKGCGSRASNVLIWNTRSPPSPDTAEGTACTRPNGCDWPACGAECEWRVNFDAPKPAPGHTDLMVSPETIDAFMEKHPLPAPDALRETLEKLRESCARIAQPWPDGDPDSQNETDKAIIAVRKEIAETIRAKPLSAFSPAPVPSGEGTSIQHIPNELGKFIEGRFSEQRYRTALSFKAAEFVHSFDRASPSPAVAAEPVAWRYELAHSGYDPKSYSNWHWHLSEAKPHVPEGSIRNLTPLFATPPVKGETIAQCLTNCAQIIDVVRGEWRATGAWSEWDQSVRDQITACLASLQSRAVQSGKESGDAEIEGFFMNAARVQAIAHTGSDPCDLSALARELREQYIAVDVTTVEFGAEFAGEASCVIPQDRVLAIADALDGASTFSSTDRGAARE